MSAPAPDPRLRLLTIGVCGYTEAAFFQDLREAGVDTFCDVRYRRGVRGREYAFANRERLEHRLGQMGIRYLHFRDLAPSPTLRAQQAAADHRARTARRQRTALSEEFIHGYKVDCLHQMDSGKFLERIGPEARVVALFCVERDPRACHRSLLAERLQAELGCEVRHLTPA
jgi:uncharacterized protein (DUF488 family)